MRGKSLHVIILALQFSLQPFYLTGIVLNSCFSLYLCSLGLRHCLIERLLLSEQIIDLLLKTLCFPLRHFQCGNSRFQLFNRCFYLFFNRLLHINTLVLCFRIELLFFSTNLLFGILQRLLPGSYTTVLLFIFPSNGIPYFLCRLQQAGGCFPLIGQRGQQSTEIILQMKMIYGLTTKRTNISMTIVQVFTQFNYFFVNAHLHCHQSIQSLAFIVFFLTVVLLRLFHSFFQFPDGLQISRQFFPKSLRSTLILPKMFQCTIELIQLHLTTIHLFQFHVDNLGIELFTLYRKVIDNLLLFLHDLNSISIHAFSCLCLFYQPFSLCLL